MATQDQINMQRRGGGRLRCTKGLTLAMLAGETEVMSWTPPAGSRVTAITLMNAVQFTGAPTHINCTVGLTAGGADFLAATDVQAPGVSNPTLATGVIADLLNWPAGVPIYAQIVDVGGTAPQGSVTVEIAYSPPNP